MVHKRSALIIAILLLGSICAGWVYTKTHEVYRSQKSIKEAYLASDGDKVRIILIWGHEALRLSASDILRLKLGNVSWSERIDNTYVTVWTIDKEVFENYTEAGLHSARFVIPYKGDVYLTLYGYARGAYVIGDDRLYKTDKEKSEEILYSIEAVNQSLYITNDGLRVEKLVAYGKSVEGEDIHKLQLGGRTINIKLKSIPPKDRVTAITVTVDGTKQGSETLQFQPGRQPFSSQEWKAMRARGALSSEEILVRSSRKQ